MKNLLMIFLMILSLNGWGVTIVVDPGHGGEDHGAKGYLHKSKKKKMVVYEKDLALQIAKEIKQTLAKRYPTFLTRSIDKTLSLEERAEIAEKLKADLFISVHINAGHTRRGKGFETYYLDNHKEKAIKKVESIENRNVDGKEKVINQILADLVITRMAPQSKKLGEVIHYNLSKNIKKKFSMRDRGVKPGLFYVLALSKRPAVLLEAGFLTNNKEISKLRSAKFQKQYAKAISDAVDEYVKKYHPESISLL